MAVFEFDEQVADTEDWSSLRWAPRLSPDAPHRLVDYDWAKSKRADGTFPAAGSPVFWDSVNQFCSECDCRACPVFVAVKRDSRLRADDTHGKLIHLIQTACPYVEDYREADAEFRRRGEA